MDYTTTNIDGRRRQVGLKLLTSVSSLQWPRIRDQDVSLYTIPDKD